MSEPSTFRVRLVNFVAAGLVASFLFLSATSGQIRAESSSQPKKATAQEWNELKTRIKDITNELAQLKNHEWAGIYKTGYWASGSILYIAPKAGFVDQPHVDYYPNEFIDGFDYGDVRVDGGRYLLHSLRGNFISEEIFFVQWGERHFLVPSGYLAQFVNEVNAGCEQFQTEKTVSHMQLYFYVKDGEERAALFGTPLLPVWACELVLKEALVATVTSVGTSSINTLSDPWRERSTKVKLNVGKSEGVWPAMQLFAESPNGILQVRVEEVAEHSADAAVLMTVNIHEKEPPLPSVGWRVSSRLRKTVGPSAFCW